MQAELNAANPKVAIHLIGINENGHQLGSPSMTTGRTLPWLDEGAMDQVWASWNVTFRDVVILDVQNRPVAVYNLTTHNLALATDYSDLKTLLLNVAQSQP